MEISQVNDLQQGWLNLGVAGAALLVVVIALWVIFYIAQHCSKSEHRTNERWSNVVDKVCARQDENMKEICKAHAELQRETNHTLMEVASTLEHIKVRVGVDHDVKKNHQNGKHLGQK